MKPTTINSSKERADEEMKETKRVFNLMIVDESGSMSVIQRQALLGLNETLSTVQKMQQLHAGIEQRVTLMTFDSTQKHYLYDNTPAQSTHLLRPGDYCPGGATPLYDAIGMGISRMNAQTTPDDNVLVTIITDGEENCSENYNLNMVKNLIEKLKKQNWTFALIGTDNLDVEGMAEDMGIDNHLEFTEDEAGTMKMFAQERKARINLNFMVAEGRPLGQGKYFSEE